MIVDTKTARYLMMVCVALDTNTLHPDARRTTTCPECNETVTAFDTDHVVWTGGRIGTCVLVIGCEGYWVINPNLVGIDSPNWTHPDDSIIIDPEV
jgi:hypothetical protein